MKRSGIAEDAPFGNGRPGLLVIVGLVLCWSLLLFLALPAGAVPAGPAAPGDTGDSRPADGSVQAAEAKRLEELEREVERLRALVEAMRDADRTPASGGDEDRLDELERRLAILAAEIERLTLGEAAAEADEVQYGFGPAASKIYRTERGVSIGGYGELIYENLDSRRDDGGETGRSDQLDFLRAIVYFGYKFNDRWLFNSEIEYEHASSGEEGEVSVEFAYVDYQWRPSLGVRAGLLLVPMGFINELHEPTVFLGAKRPEVERAIIPTTWRENGAGIYGDVGPFVYRAYVLNGFDAAGFSASGLRGGRQKGSKAKADDFAFTGRLDYVGTPGLTAGLSVWWGNSGQDLQDASGGSIDATTTLLEGHVEWVWRGLSLRALGVSARVDDAEELNLALSYADEASVGERLEGGYLQIGYDLLARDEGRQSLIPYLRWESFDTQAEVPGGFSRDPARDQEILTFGLAWQPIDQVVLKVDYQDRDNEAGTGLDQFNVLLGYIF